MPKTYWLDLAFNAPLIGIRKRWPNVLHAVELEGLPGPGKDGLASSVCGLSGVRVATWGDTIGLWPPAVKGLGEKVRCKECYEVCKRKKPRTRFRVAS